MLIGIFDSLGAQTDRLRCKVCQNLILSPINTGLLRHAVATALTVYGIETQYLGTPRTRSEFVATALTVYGIETTKIKEDYSSGKTLQQLLPFTVLKHGLFRKDILLVYLGCNSSYRLRY